MALPVEINPLLLASKTSGYSVSKSLRFRSSASAYLSRTPSVTGNRQTWTWSGWVKRGALTSTGQIFGSNYSAGGFGAAFGNYGGSGVSPEVIGVTLYAVGTVTSTPVFRDPSAWYHIVLRFDSTQATQANRFILYVNGVQQTLSAALNVTQNANYNVNLSGAAHSMFGDTGGYDIDGYLAEVNFVDGQYLAPTSFGAYDINGVWQPINYSGSYGTNGFHLTFGNTTSTTTLGYDTSGNSNNWTTNNISLTAGATYDSMTDSPTVTSASVANYAVMNPNFVTPSTTFSNGNLTLTKTGSTDVIAASTIAMPSGKFYWELTVTSLSASSNLSVGVVKDTQTNGTYSSTLVAYWNGNGNAYRYGTNLGAVGTTFATGNVLGFALDMTAGTITLYKNNTSIGTISSLDTTIPHYVFWDSYASGEVGNYNFGQQPFTYTPPTGFNALNTYNLPTPTIANGAQYMAATLYTGNGSTQSITNGGNNTIGTTFQPDFVWIKSRSDALGHRLLNSITGVYNYLISNSTLAESTDTTSLTAFNSNGFSLGAASGNGFNTNGSTYVGWQWKANGSGVSNTNGSITSTVSANTTAGFSVVTFTSLASGTSTIGHGLGVAPNMIFLKTRNTGADWVVYHSAVSTSTSLFLKLDTTDALLTSAGVWGAALPTSSVFGITNASTIPGSATAVAYCFAAVAGYSAFGSYTGNGSLDGPFLYFGFRPRFIMWKRTDTAGYPWYMMDTSRAPYNQMTAVLYANASDAEANFGGEGQDFVSNGWKVRASSPGSNASGGTYIWAAFAENPFNSSRAR